MIDIILWLSLAFIAPFLGVLAGAYLDRHFAQRPKRRTRPVVFDEWRGL